MHQAALKARISKVLKTLTYREREIIRLRYGLADGYSYTLEEVGHIFSVTRERIRQIESKAVRKLQQPHRSRELVSFLDGLEDDYGGDGDNEADKILPDPPEEPPYPVHKRLYTRDIKEIFDVDDSTVIRWKTKGLRGQKRSGENGKGLMFMTSTDILHEFITSMLAENGNGNIDHLKKNAGLREKLQAGLRRLEEWARAMQEQQIPHEQDTEPAPATSSDEEAA